METGMTFTLFFHENSCFLSKPRNYGLAKIQWHRGKSGFHTAQAYSSCCPSVGSHVIFLQFLTYQAVVRGYCSSNFELHHFTSLSSNYKWKGRLKAHSPEKWGTGLWVCSNDITLEDATDRLYISPSLPLTNSGGSWFILYTIWNILV